MWGERWVGEKGGGGGVEESNHRNMRIRFEEKKGCHIDSSRKKGRGRGEGIGWEVGEHTVSQWEKTSLYGIKTPERMGYLALEEA